MNLKSNQKLFTKRHISNIFFYIFFLYILISTFLEKTKGREVKVVTLTISAVSPFTEVTGTVSPWPSLAGVLVDSPDGPSSALFEFSVKPS